MRDVHMKRVLCVGVMLLASAAMMSAAATKKELRRIREAAVVLHEIHRAADKDIP